MKKLDRRDFIKKSTLTAAAISSTPLLISCVNTQVKKIMALIWGLLQLQNSPQYVPLL